MKYWGYKIVIHPLWDAETTYTLYRRVGMPGSGPVRIGVWIRTAPDRTPGSYLRPLTKPLTRWVAILPRGKRRTHACARAPFPYSSKNPMFGRGTNASRRSFRSCCRHRLRTKLRTLRSINYVLRLEACLVAEEDVVAECISKVGFWRRVSWSPFFPNQWRAGGLM